MSLTARARHTINHAPTEDIGRAIVRRMVRVHFAARGYGETELSQAINLYMGDKS